MNWTLAGISLYVVAQLGVGLWVARRIHTEADYILAGRTLGYGLAIFTIFATWFGAETVIGAAGSIYDRGVSGGSADPFGYGLCLLFMGLVFAAPLRRRRLTTLADLFRDRYSVGVERLAVILMVPTSILWAAAQVRAFGQVVSASSDLEVTVTITIAAAVVIAYSVMGGLLAAVWTDLIQGIALIAGLVVLFVVVLSAGGFETAREIDPARLQLFGGGQVPWYEVVESWAIPIFGSVVAAELVQRVLASRSPTVAQRATILASGLYLLVGIIPVTIGLIGPHLVPGLVFPEQVLPQVALAFLPPLLYMIFAGALLSAILSTVDSALIVASSLVSHNLVVPLRPDMPESRKIWIARGGVIVGGLLAYVLALHAEGVYHLVSEASAFGSSGIFVIFAFGLFTTWGRSASAIAALVAGIGVYVVGSYVLELSFAYIASLAAAAAAYVGIGLVEAVVAPANRPVGVDAG